MRVIIGLGNPGAYYQCTRHNMGFLVLDALARNLKVPFGAEMFHCLLAEGRIGDTPVLLVKPQTFMNMSGKGVKKLVDYLGNDIKSILVVHDDLDLPFGTIRLKTGGGHGGHKGLISLIEYLGSADFIRVRLGISKPENREMIESYVLQQFTEEELQKLPEILEGACDAITLTITSGAHTAMNKYHCKQRRNDNSLKPAVKNNGEDTSGTTKGINLIKEA